MQTTHLARALAQHRSVRGPAALPPKEPPAPQAPNPLLAALQRQVRREPRTLMEMARDRDGFRHAWQ